MSRYAPGRNRTYGLALRRRTLYPLSYRREEVSVPPGRPPPMHRIGSPHGDAARTFTLELAEPFVISRSADTEAEVVQVAIRHDGVVGYGEGAPDPRYGESCRVALDVLRAGGGRCWATTRSPWRRLSAASNALPRPDGAPSARSTAPCTTWSASSAASRCGACSASTRSAAADLLHDQHRHAGGHRRPRPPCGRLPRPQDQGGRPGRPGAGARRARRGPGRADPGRRQRGLDGRVHHARSARSWWR